MPKFLLRPVQLSLIATDRTLDWDDIDAPRPRRGASLTNNYAAQWTSYVNAAKEAGWAPADVVARGTEALAMDLAESGLRDWAPSTVTRYAKLARYAGLDPATHPPPRSAPTDPSDHRTLWRSTLHPASQRNALAAVITWHHALELPDLLNLRTTSVSTTPQGGISIQHSTGKLHVPVGASDLNRWLSSRQSWRPNQWLFCTTHPSKTGGAPGAQLSIRGFQASFARHADLTGNPGLTWQRYRTLARRHSAADQPEGAERRQIDGL